MKWKTDGEGDGDDDENASDLKNKCGSPRAPSSLQRSSDQALTHGAIMLLLSLLLLS